MIITISDAYFPCVCTLIFFFRRALTTAFHAWIGVDSSLAMALLCGLTGLAFIIWLIKKRRIIIKKTLLVLLINLFLCICSIVLAPNEYGKEFLSDFLLYCIIAGVMITFVTDYEAMIKVYCIFSVIVFILCAPLPFISGTLKYLDMGYFASGMTYGEWVMTPCFIGIYILRKRYSKKILWPIEIICLIITTLYANRSSLLSIVLFVIFYELLIEKKRGWNTYIKWGGYWS